MIPRAGGAQKAVFVQGASSTLMLSHPEQLAARIEEASSAQ